MNAFIREVYARRGLSGGGLILGVTQMLRKRWAYLRGLCGRGLIGGEIRYHSNIARFYLIGISLVGLS